MNTNIFSQFIKTVILFLSYSEITLLFRVYYIMFKGKNIHYLDMLDKIRSEVLKGIESGDSLEKIIASKPTKEFDPIWGGGFLNPDKFTELVYRDLSR